MKKKLHPLTYTALTILLTGFCIGSLNAQLVNVIRINSGGGTQNFGGEAWAPDQYFTGGTPYSTGSAISNTTQDQIYQSERYGNVSYAIPVSSAGTYAVDLHLAEIYFNTTGSRVFNINIENGQFVRNNLDLIQTIGSMNQAYVLRADNLNITDGTINITFTSVVDNAKISGISVGRYNTPPVVANGLPDKTAVVGQQFNFTFPSNTFSDADPATVLTYSASLSDGNPLPSWLTFNANTRIFTGTPAVGNVGTLGVRVTASDGNGGSANDIFILTVSQSGFASTLYRALNLNGTALSIDGNSWQSSTGASNFNYAQTGGGVFANQGVTLIPATDANRATMIRSSVWGNTVNLNVTSVPSGSYDVYLYVWEDNQNQTFSIALEGIVVIPTYNSGSAGTWNKLGPFRASITDGEINVSANGGHACLSGIEIWTAPNPPVVSNPIADQIAIAAETFNYTVPSNTFSDPDAGTNLTYSVSLSNGSALPSWLTFNANTRTFTGTPTSGNAGALNVRVTATDGDGGSVSDVFMLTVNTGVYTFYRAINLNGAALTIDGNNWQASAGAPNFSYSAGTVNNQNVPLSPAADANRAAMIRSSIWGNLSLTVSAVPTGNYAIWVYSWEDDLSSSFSLSLEGTTALSNYNTGSAGTWVKHGPFLRTISDGSINLSTSGAGGAVLSGIEIYTTSGSPSVPVTGVSISPTTLSITPGQTGQLTKTIAPANATNQSVTWSSDNTAVATVNSTGLVTAVAPGTTSITITTVSGGFASSAAVTVSIPVTDVSVSPTTLSLMPSQAGQLTKTITPSNATNQNVTWTSSDETVATVDNNGLVTAISTGNAVITATTIDGGFVDVSIVTVYQTGQVPDALEIAALKDIYNSTNGANWNSKTNWPSTEQEWSAVQAIGDLEWFGVGISNGDVNQLSLPGNNLDGPIPTSIANLSGLQAVNFADNHLTGSLTNWISSGNIIVVFLQNNELTGPLPAMIMNTTLTNLNISGNSILGSLPASISNLKSIVNLNLSGNQLSGPLPASLGLLSYTCSGNQICGSSIHLADNKFTSLPSEFWNLFESPTIIWLDNNEITDIGTVPNNLTLAGRLSLNGNFLSYKDLESAFNYPDLLISFQSQRVDPSDIDFTLGQSLELAFEQPSTLVDVLWEKLQSGSWQDISTLDESSAQNIFLRNVSSLSDEGTYRYTVFKSQEEYPYVQSGPIEIHVIEKSEMQVMNEFAFHYKYDSRKRMSHKKVPGAEWVYMVYDNRDRLVMTQDGEQRNNSPAEWTFTKYDELNRPILTGIYKDASSLDQDDMQGVIDAFYVAAESNADEWFEIRGGTVHGYTNLSFPNVSLENDYLTVTYYDDYEFQPQIGSTASDFNYDNNQLTASGNDPAQRAEEFDRVQGQVTGTKIKNLDANEFLWSINYYDDRYRVIQTIAQNNKSGLDKVTNVYDFTGEVLRTRTDHAVANATTLAVRTTRKLSYDHAGRLLQTEHQTEYEDEGAMNVADPVVLAKLEYNELGQLVTKNLHGEDESSYKQQVDYRYNIRGWLTRINDSDLSIVEGGPKDYFGMELGYNESIGIAAGLQHNGNISAIKWSTNQGLGFNDSGLEIFEPTARAYAFDYDPLNRLKKSDHFENSVGWNAAESFHENIDKYDLNGNIEELSRTGKGGNNMDKLYYSYSGNRLQKVVDDGNDGEGFKDGNTTGIDYIYDDNGNMVTDKNKSMATIEYNHLNLPAKVIKEDGQYVKYIYNAAGVKLRQEVYDDEDVLKKKTDYLGEFYYENDTLKFINHEEGRIVMTGPGPEYQYTLKDHLGNSRITFTTIQQVESFVANMNTDRAEEEQLDFGAYNSFTNEALDPTPTGSENDKILILNGGYSGQVGLTKSFSVVPGDVIATEVHAKYLEPTGNPSNLVNFAAALTEAFGLTPNFPGEGATAFEALNSFGSFIAGGGREDENNEPRGFINIIVFDKDYNFVDAAFRQIKASDLPTTDTISLKLKIRQAGYAYVFLSNESPTLQQIGFDTYVATQHHSEVIQQDDYYPFGLTFNSYRREISVENRYLYNQGTAGKKFNTERITDLDLNIDLTKYRAYDPAIARWWQVDPKVDETYGWTPYNYGFNNPILYNDPEGDIPPLIWAILAVAALVLDAEEAEAPRTYVTPETIQQDQESRDYNRNANDAVKTVVNPTNIVRKVVGQGMRNTLNAEKKTTPAAETTKTSREARREVMRKEGIPTSQQPSSQSKNKSGREYTYDVPKEGGGTEKKSVQQQTMDKSHEDKPHWEAGKVKTDESGNTRMNNYGRPALQNDKSKVEYKKEGL